MDESLSKVILKVIETKQPKDVKELVQFVQEQVDANLDDISREVKNLQQKGLVTLEESTVPTNRLSDFLFSRKNVWFWFTISLILLAFISILFFPESGTPLSYLRYVFGFIFVAILPGYCLVSILFARENKLDLIEETVLSVALSFGIVGLTGLFLGLSPIGINFTSITVSLSVIVLVLAVVAFIRKRI